MFFNKPFNPQPIQPPRAIRTLPFDLLRTGIYPREAGIRDAAIMAGPSPHIAAWLPQRMLFANRHQARQQVAPQPLSPVMAARPSGTFLRTMSQRSHPLTLQPAYRAAQHLAAQQMAQVRPPSAQSQKAATEAQILDRLGRTVPRIGERIDPRELTAAIDHQKAFNQFRSQQASEKMGDAVQQAFNTRLNAVRGLGR